MTAVYLCSWPQPHGSPEIQPLYYYRRRWLSLARATARPSTSGRPGARRFRLARGSTARAREPDHAAYHPRLPRVVPSPSREPAPSLRNRLGLKSTCGPAPVPCTTLDCVLRAAAHPALHCSTHPSPLRRTLHTDHAPATYIHSASGWTCACWFPVCRVCTLAAPRPRCHHFVAPASSSTDARGRQHCHTVVRQDRLQCNQALALEFCNASGRIANEQRKPPAPSNRCHSSMTHRYICFTRPLRALLKRGRAPAAPRVVRLQCSLNPK